MKRKGGNGTKQKQPQVLIDKYLVDDACRKADTWSEDSCFEVGEAMTKMFEESCGSEVIAETPMSQLVSLKHLAEQWLTVYATPYRPRIVEVIRVFENAVYARERQLEVSDVIDNGKSSLSATKSNAKKGKRGRKRVYNAGEDEKLLNKWEKSDPRHPTYEVFARSLNNGMSGRAVHLAIQRARARRRNKIAP